MSGPGHRPRVAVPTPEHPAPRDDVADLIMDLAEWAVDDLTRAGADVVRVPPGSPAPSLDDVDAVVLLGGGDVDPALSRDEPRASDRDEVGHVDRRRDDLEVDLVRRAVDRRMPVLAICRGMQVVNVALGGTLRLAMAASHVTHHGATGAPLMVQHPVRPDPGTALEDLLGAGWCEVWSGHHQGVDRLAGTLRPVAHADDGVVEAVEHVEAPLLGVQWHPEHRPTGRRAADAPPDVAFLDLVERARSASLSPRA